MRTQKSKPPGNKILATAEHDDKQKGVTAKRNASTRSPLEGNPGKKQKDTKKSGDVDTTTNTMDTNCSGSINITDISDSYQAHDTPKQLDGEQSPTINTEHPEHNMPLHTLLEELKEIKSSIQNLNDKLDQELTTRATNYKTLHSMVTSQHNQIKLLTKANENLNEQNRKLQIEVVNTQTDMLRLKVDFTGINESPYETYEQLCNKIAEAMMPTCSGINDEAKWKTSIEIPITDCERLGNYTKKQKESSKNNLLIYET